MWHSPRRPESVVSHDPLFLHRFRVNFQHPAAVPSPHLVSETPARSPKCVLTKLQRRSPPHIPVNLEQVALLVWKANFALFVEARLL